ncbi:hypothetical protein PTKIN_Ptkin01aG0277200 [Pterospermum kingtungense]
MPSILKRYFPDWSCIHNYEEAYNGRIWFLWKCPFQVQHVASSSQSITCLVKYHQKQFCFTAIYGANDGITRRHLWSHLQLLYSDLHNNPWMLAGDYNIIADPSESSNSGCSFDGEMHEFNDYRVRLSLMDHVFDGPVFTWKNNQDESFLTKKLDRVLVNDVWYMNFPCSSVEFLSPEISDHCPAFIRFLVSVYPWSSYDSVAP